MTKGFERLLRRMLWTVSALCLAGAAILAVQINFLPKESPELPFRAGTNLPNAEKAEKTDPAIEQLSRIAMTQRIVPPKVQKAAPPPPPALATLIQIKGIMEYEKAESNEAIIESVLSRQSRSYRIGDSVDGVAAKILGIGSKVTFQYNGDSVELGVNDGGRADHQPIARPEDKGDVRITSNDRNESR
ncbi:MAG: hypothetical protein L6Q38_04145 [Nitrospira sp.]|nr:hypothetical protein [Nitrospira sp.]